MSTYYEDSQESNVYYLARIESAALGESEAKHTPQIEVGISVLGFYSGKDFTALNGPPRTIYLSLTEGTLGTPSAPGWVATLLADLGFKGPSFNDLAPLLGQERRASCKHEPDQQGEPREKWSLFPNSRSPKNPAQPKTVRAIDTQHSQLLKQFFAKSGSAPMPPAKPAPKSKPPRQTVPADEPDHHPDSGAADVPF